PAQRHGERLELKNGGQRPAPDLHLVRQSDRYGQMQITAWRHMHQELDRSGPFKDWPKDQDLPVVEGTVVRMKVERLPDGRKADKDMWLWIAGPMEPDAGLARLSPPVRSSAFPPVQQGLPGDGPCAPGVGAGHRPVGGAGAGGLHPAAA